MRESFIPQTLRYRGDFIGIIHKSFLVASVLVVSCFFCGFVEVSSIVKEETLKKTLQ